MFCEMLAVPPVELIATNFIGGTQFLPISMPITVGELSIFTSPVLSASIRQRRVKSRTEGPAPRRDEPV
jgi:hypothetical protein